jgi:hypothetical protein
MPISCPKISSLSAEVYWVGIRSDISRFGSEATIVEMGPRLVGREDEDDSEAVRKIKHLGRRLKWDFGFPIARGLSQ